MIELYNQIKKDFRIIQPGVDINKLVFTIYQHINEILDGVNTTSTYTSSSYICTDYYRLPISEEMHYILSFYVKTRYSFDMDKLLQIIISNRSVKLNKI